MEAIQVGQEFTGRYFKDESITVTAILPTSNPSVRYIEFNYHLQGYGSERKRLSEESYFLDLYEAAL